MAGGILSLDLATKVGWAACSQLSRPATPLERHTAEPLPIKSGVHRIAQPGASTTVFYGSFGQWLSDMLTVHQPGILVFEAPLIHGGHTHIDTARKLMGLAAITEYIAAIREIRQVFEANNSTVKKHFTGNGRAQKADTIAACKVRGWSPADDNEADALALLDFALHQLAPKRSAA